MLVGYRAAVKSNKSEWVWCITSMDLSCIGISYSASVPCSLLYTCCSMCTNNLSGGVHVSTQYHYLNYVMYLRSIVIIDNMQIEIV